MMGTRSPQFAATIRRRWLAVAGYIVFALLGAGGVFVAGEAALAAALRNPTPTRYDMLVRQCKAAAPAHAGTCGALVRDKYSAMACIWDTTGANLHFYLNPAFSADEAGADTATVEHVDRCRQALGMRRTRKDSVTVFFNTPAGLAAVDYLRGIPAYCAQHIVEFPDWANCTDVAASR